MRRHPFFGVPNNMWFRVRVGHCAAAHRLSIGSRHAGSEVKIDFHGVALKLVEKCGESMYTRVCLQNRLE